MSYEVIARKWRPQRFDDVVGQDHVTRTLRNAIEGKRLAHAYLFVGPRGVGKTSIARIFARALNCVTGPTMEPCGTCDACREIAAGSSLDVMEIDGASNNGVDQVRDLRENVKYAPARGPYKIYLIDEVHMLSTGAFNALLKTLEEPPPHVKFFFATTEPQKIPATVISRCQRFDLRRIPVAQIVDRLRLIAQEEKVTIDEAALLAIARGAEGGLRDAESALDQLISFRGNVLAEEDVLAIFGLVSQSQLESLAGAVLAGDMKRSLEILAGLDAAGKDLQRLVVELIMHFRNLLVFMAVGPVPGALDVTDAQIAALKGQAAATSVARVLRIVETLTECEEKLRYALSRRTLIETAVIRSARAASVVSLDEVIQRINEIRSGGGAVSPAGEPARAEAPREAPAADAAPAPVRAAPAKDAPAAAGPADGARELERLRREWKSIIHEVGQRAVGARQALLDSLPLRVEGEKVTIGVDREFADEVERLSHDGRERRVLELALTQSLKRKVAVTVELMAPPADGETRSAPAETPEPAAPGAAEPPAPTPGERRPSAEWLKDDAVQRTLKIFDGSILEVRE